MLSHPRILSFIPPPLSYPLPAVLSMPSSNQGWPEEFGFQLGGSGPSYILSVEEGSSAHLAGLQAGDQVLEIEGHNVSTLAPQAVIAIAQTQKNIPPSIGVVSRIQQVRQHHNHHSNKTFLGQRLVTVLSFYHICYEHLLEMILHRLKISWGKE